MYFQIGDFRLAYAEHGCGRPVMLVHGFPLNRAIWEGQVAAFSDQYRLILPDMRGHGESSAPPGPYTMDLMADDCAALLDALHICEPVVLGGLSMGGYIAMAFARRHPQRLAGLLLTATRAGADSPAGKEGRLKAIAAAEQTGSIQPTIASMLPKLLAPQTYAQNPALVNQVRTIMEQTSLAGVIQAQQGMLERPDASETLWKLKVPGCVLFGQQDQIISAEEAIYLGSLFPDGALGTIQEAGHLLNMEQPAEFNAHVLDWLDDVFGRRYRETG